MHTWTYSLEACCTFVVQAGVLLGWAVCPLEVLSAPLAHSGASPRRWSPPQPLLHCKKRWLGSAGR